MLAVAAANTGPPRRGESVRGPHRAQGPDYEEVVRAEIVGAVNRRTAVTTRELPSFGQLKLAEKALIGG